MAFHKTQTILPIIFSMTLEAIDMPLVAAPHNGPKLAIECFCARIVICFLVSLLGIWNKPKLEQCTKLRRCPVKGDGIQPGAIGPQHREDSALNQGGMSPKSGLQRSSVWSKNNKDTGISKDLSNGDLMEAACHNGYDVKSKLCVSDNEASIMSTDRRTSGAGLNLHFCMAILLSTNKLTPEKT